jgi:predicted nucleic acid-binding protein
VASVPSGGSPTSQLSAVVLDASVWVSSLLPNDRNHAPATSWIASHVSNNGLMVAPLLLVTETAGAIARVAQNPGLARASVNQLYAFPVMSLLPLDQPLVDEATDMAINFNLKGADAFYVAVAKLLGIPLVTFDTEQLTRPANIITTIKP